jgi:transcriptional regulator with XRE-family HTH domain
MSIGERLKQVREQAGLKQKEMAEFLELGKPGYNRIETGKVEITVKHLLKIAERFKISLDWLLLGKEEKSDIDGFGKFMGAVKEMLNDMEKDAGFFHAMLSHYHHLKERKSSDKENATQTQEV